MNTNLSSQIKNSDLLAYLEHSAEPHIKRTIDQDPALRQRAVALAQQQKRLQAQLFRQTCPDAQTIGDYTLNMLPKKEVADLATHLHFCPHCQRELAITTRFIEVPAPADTLANRLRVVLAKIWQPKSEAGSPTPQMALRGDDSAQTVIYDGDNGTRVMLNTHPDPTQPEKYAITGLMIGSVSQNSAVALWKDDEIIASIPVEDSGNFSFNALNSGEYELILKSPQLIIHIQSFRI